MPKMSSQIRLEEKLYDKVKAIAEKELRSMNAQMEYFIIRGVENYEIDNGEVTIQIEG